MGWLILIGRRKYENIYCVSVTINERLLNILNSRFNIELVDNYERYPTSTSLQFERDYVAYIEKLFKDVFFKEKLNVTLNIFDIKIDCLISFLKKYVANNLIGDASMVWRSRNHEDNSSNSDVLVYEKKLLSKMMAGSNQKIIGFVHPKKMIINHCKLIFNLWRSLKFLLLPPKKATMGPEQGYKIIFEQMYRTMDNPDFKAFFNYFGNRNDVLYLCPDRKCEIYQFLKHEGKAVITPSHVVLQSDLKKQISLFSRVVAKMFLTRKLLSRHIIKASLLRIFYFQVFYGSLFERVKPLLYLHTSSAYLSHHPVITATCNKYNIKHIGYMHSQFTHLRAKYGFIDFHYFGLLGQRFRDSYAKYWPDDIHYKILGPQSLEASENKTIIIDNDRFTIGIMARPIKDKLGGYSYSEFINKIWTTLYELNIPNLHVVFKEWGSMEWTESLKESLNNRMPISFENAYHHQSNENKRIYAGEVITRSDIVIISSPGYSTTAFDAIGKKKKLVVLLAEDILPHPFEDYTIPLVAKTQKELRASLQWLMDTPQKQYEKLIEPVIHDWSKTANGNLVKDFISSIENDFIWDRL